MKPYLIVSGTIFLLIVMVHGLRVAGEGLSLLREPSFIIASALAIGMCAWAFILLRRIK